MRSVIFRLNIYLRTITGRNPPILLRAKIVRGQQRFCLHSINSSLSLVLITLDASLLLFG